MPSRTVILGLLCWGLAQAANMPTGLSIDQITTRIDQADRDKQANMPEFSVTRKYVLYNTHMKTDAEMLVKVSYRKGEGKTFEILQTSNAEGMSKRVFQHLIDAEKDPVREERSRLNSRNYTFDLAGMDRVGGRQCYVLELHPRWKRKELMNGRVWVDAEDFGIAKLEGNPAANLSFWVGKPHITQTWTKTGDYWMAAENHSHSESRLLGTSDLTVRNMEYEIKAAAKTGSRVPTASADPSGASLRASPRAER